MSRLGWDGNVEASSAEMSGYDMLAGKVRWGQLWRGAPRDQIALNNLSYLDISSIFGQE